ncbi:MAG: hypothetical protein UX07_C0007G0003 [Parcubacteria group bacterium GW2011_GWA2_45_30]|nr:MAG: hypothetical protein UX07_C0007G0003 [Parcubacteria group bacterium GW2011_GWA2_45_30]
MPKDQKQSNAFFACSIPLDLTPSEERVWLVLNKLSVEYKVELGRTDQNRIVTPDANEMLAYDSQNEIYSIISRDEFYLPENQRRLADVTKTHVMVSFDQRTGLGGPGGKSEIEDGKPRLLETWVNAATRETIEETLFDLSDRGIYPYIHYMERPHLTNPYFTIAFLLNAHNIKFRKDGKIMDPNVEPKLSRFYRLDSIPIEDPLNSELRSFKKDEEEHGRRKGIIEQVGTYHAALRRIVGILLQLRQPILTELGRPDCENADDLVQMLLRRYDYKHIFSLRMLQTFASLKRMDVIVNHFLKGNNGGIYNRRLASYMIKNLILKIDDEALQNEAMSALQARLRGDLAGDKAFSWFDLQKNAVHGSFNQLVEYCKFRKSRIYLKRQDEQEALAVPDEDLTVAPESGEYVKEEDRRPDYEKLWLPRETKSAVQR